MNAPAHFPRIEFRAESLRIAGKKVAGDGGTLDVFDPYTGAVVGTVPRASARQVAEAFRIAAGYKAKLTRYDRQKILMRTGELIAARKDQPRAPCAQIRIERRQA